MDKLLAVQRLKEARANKTHRVMGEFKRGELHSGSAQGPQVTDRSQAIAIALSEAKKATQK